MMRIAVVGAEAPALAERVRGAGIRTYGAGGEIGLATCDAVAFLGARLHDEGLIGRCLARGKHVLLDAPTSLSGASLDTLAKQASRSGVQLALLNPDRFLPSRRLIRQQVDAGRLGEPGLVRMHHWRSREGAHRGDPFAAAVRDLDVAIWLIGRAPNLTYAVAAAGGCQLHLGFPDGPMALIDYAECLPTGDGYRSLSLIGSSGAAYADDHLNVQLLFRGAQARAIPVSETGHETAAMLQELVGAIDRGDDLSSSVAAWRRAVAVAEAGRQSASARRAVPMED